MKNASDQLWYTWEQGNFTGSNKPHCRVVLSKKPLKTSRDLFRSQLFGNQYNSDEWFEIPTVLIQQLNRNHRVGTDASSMTLTLNNADPISTGENLDLNYAGGTSYPTKRDLKEIGSPGALSYRRGLSSDGSGPNPWGHVPSNYVDAFLPNRLLWTYEGYGTDGADLPWDDTNLVLTGTWLIDRVNIDAKSGTITLECRDLAKLLIEQRLYPPIVPLENYPVEFCTDQTEVVSVTSTVSSTTSAPEVTGPNVAKHSLEVWDSSAAPWYGTNANVYGHKASDAFDGDPSTFWISMRNSQPNADWSYEWLDGVCNGEPINRVEFRPWVGSYKVYVGVMVDGVWQGNQRVPYNRNAEPAYPNTSDIPYVKSFNMPAGENWYKIDLGQTYNADKVRLVFTNLQWFGRISGGDYRAGVYEMKAYGFTPAGTTTTETEVEEDVTNFIPGNITDYTDMVKLFVAWSGFYWPLGEDDPLFLKEEWGSRGGRAWGDFFYSGAYPVEPACIPSSYWDNKSVMDAINQIKETLGFVAYVDASGGFIWRPPNIWSNGNYVAGVGWVGDQSIPIVAENNVLIDYGITVDDAALRSEIVVVSSDEPTIYGSFSPGYATGEESPASNEVLGNLTNDQINSLQAVTDTSLLAGQQRVMLVPDYPFGQNLDDEEAARAEVEKFAYLTSLWIHWSYRKGKVKIPCNPALDIDDQIRIYEAKTSETYIHYILGMSTTLNMQSGVYTADIETHWLGNGPNSIWHVYKNEMPPALYAYLCQQEIIECDPNDSTDPIPWTLPGAPEVPDLPPGYTRPDLGIPYPTLPGVDPAAPIDDGVPGSGDSGGTVSPGVVSSCSNEFMWAYWPGTGPDPNTGAALTGSPASRRRLNYSDASGGYTVLDNRVWPAFQLLANIFYERGVYIATASGKVHRKIAGSSQWSNHSWGTACDINSGALPRGKSIYSYSTSVRDDYLYIAQRASDIRGRDKNSGQWVRVFKWGQDFATPDPMHWQVCCKASDLASGVWDVSGGYPPVPL